MKRSLANLAVVFALGSACDDKNDDATSDAKSADANEGDKPGAFTAYKLKSMASEATVNVKVISDGVRALYDNERVGPDGEMVRSLPPSAPATPAKGSCCKQDKGLCPADAKAWQAEGWTMVNFQPMSPIRYSYALDVEGDTFTVHAYGDLDCDGTFSDYALSGHVQDGSVVLDSELKITDPLE